MSEDCGSRPTVSEIVWLIISEVKKLCVNTKLDPAHSDLAELTLNYFDVIIKISKICTLISESVVSRLDEEDLQPSAAEVKGQERIHTRRRRSRSNINSCHLLGEFPVSLDAAAPAASFQLIDTQAEDSPPWAAGWGVPPGLELCWWSLTCSRNLSLLLPGGEGLLADTINFSSAAPAFKSNLLCRQSSNVIYRQVFTCWWSRLVKRPIDSLHSAVLGGGIT